MAKAGRGDDQYMLRFPEGLRQRIKAAAEAHGRSINSEIISVLEEFYIDETLAETLERRSVESALTLKANAAASVDQRLTAIEQKLDQLMKRLDN